MKQLDWVRELTNQLAARIKHRLLPFGTILQPMLPNLITRDALEEQRARFPSMRIYLGRTLRGNVLVRWMESSTSHASCTRARSSLVTPVM